LGSIVAELGIRGRILVKDAMSSPVIWVRKGSTVLEAAQLMRKHRIGGVVVLDEHEEPVGVVTSRNIVEHVVAEDKRASKLRVEDVMTKGLPTIDAEATLVEAARMMSQLNVMRLGVMHRGKLVGIITSRDILSVTPELIEIMIERAKIEYEEAEEGTPISGYCDRCGQWSEDLKEVEGQFLCEECRIELSEEEEG